ncbi:MAG: bifunctional hydroxymethylpyrimidine kinase/phosphomethylpyrimidine kinase [Verrucomicrobiota bacterium]
MEITETPVALTIATSDSGGGAGIQADLLTFRQCNCFGVSAFAALTAQNPEGVSAIHELPPEFLQAQLMQLIDYFPIRAAKTGMLFSDSLIRTTAAFIRENEIPLVVDPVMVSTSGARLLQEDAIQTLKQELLPLATLITPNLDEAGVLLGQRPETIEDMESATQTLARDYGTAVLLKGGHLASDQIQDLLVSADGKMERISSTRIHGVDTHGSGCTLSAAITANLANGQGMANAVRSGHAFLTEGMRHPVVIKGRAFIRR